MELLQPEHVQICKEALDWRNAIRTAVFPLEKHGYVRPCYKEAIIANVEALGPYIVIAPHVALPHARPEQGVRKTQIGVTLFREEILFEKEDVSARLFVTLAATDSNTHLEAMEKIAEILGNEKNVEKILAVSDVRTLYQSFQ